MTLVNTYRHVTQNKRKIQKHSITSKNSLVLFLCSQLLYPSLILTTTDLFLHNTAFSTKSYVCNNTYVSFGICKHFSFNITYWRLIHVAACISTLFLFVAGLYFIVWICRNLFIYLPVEGHWSCIQVLAITNKPDIFVYRFSYEHEFLFL